MRTWRDRRAKPWQAADHPANSRAHTPAARRAPRARPRCLPGGRTGGNQPREPRSTCTHVRPRLGAGFDLGQIADGCGRYAELDETTEKAMFKHILIPTDGSSMAAKAIAAGVPLAAEMGARVTGFHAQEPRPLRFESGGYGAEKDLIAELDRRSREFAERCVGQVEHAARAAGVAFEPVVVKSQRPHEAIIEAAKERNCDAIFM